MKKNVMLHSEKSFAIQRHKQDAPNSMPAHHYHHNIEVYYLYSGERYYFIKDRTYHIKKGSLVFIKEYDIHSTANAKDLGYERFVFNFDRSYIADFEGLLDINLFEFFDNNIHIVELSSDDQLLVEEILKKMNYEYINQTPNYNAFIKNAIVQILLTALEYKKNLPKENDNLSISKSLISEISGYINHNYNEDISLSSISEKFFISIYHLSRTFKQETGISFVDYLNNVRIKEACILLDISDLNVTQISEKVGYKTATHFDRVFKKITGISPLAYKKRKS